ncbi:MAG: hypothetical protein JSW34_12900 [Candidatus Zixiibacteriota bacterium]|nr:MAG: hypothetical protein JSW34_12900 [candidate division Zixibacteria bacterium]
MASTVIMDVVMFALLSATGDPQYIIFSMIADATSATLDFLGISVAASITLGGILHYLIGLVLGVIFAVLVARVKILQDRSTAALSLIGLVYTEIMSFCLLIPAVIILNMSRSDTLEVFGIAVFLHALWGALLGLILVRLTAFVTYPRLD